MSQKPPFPRTPAEDMADLRGRLEALFERVNYLVRLVEGGVIGEELSHEERRRREIVGVGNLAIRWAQALGSADEARELLRDRLEGDPTLLEHALEALRSPLPERPAHWPTPRTVEPLPDPGHPIEDAREALREQLRKHAEADTSS